MEIYVNIKGSKKNIYVVGVCDEGEDSFFDCDCPASHHSANQICKHRLTLLKGDFSNIIDTDIEDIELLKKFISNVDIKNNIEEIEKIESAFNRIQAEEKELKNMLAKMKRELLNKFYQKAVDEYNNETDE